MANQKANQLQEFALNTGKQKTRQNVCNLIWIVSVMNDVTLSRKAALKTELHTFSMI